MDPLDLVGDVLDGQFKVEEFVGEGALSVVYRGRSEVFEAPVAIKCLDLPSTLDATLAASVVTSFQEGCKLHYRLARGHLAIAQTFASGTTVAPRTGSQVPYIVREWFEGESLARDLRRRRAEGEGGRSLAETIALFEPIASALVYAHGEDATHLSLMPSNLFLAKHGDEVSLKLLDFGVGRVVDEVGSSRDGAPPPRVKLLLPTYAAPEQLLGTLGPTGPWTDVYALALVLLEVLADRAVMGEKDPSALIARALNKLSRPTPASLGIDLPPSVAAAFERALALEPESRQATVAEFWADISDPVKPVPVRSNRRKLAVYLRRLRRSRRVEQRRAPSDSFPPEEPPTTKARGVVAMLTGARVRASTRPPPPSALPPRRPPLPTAKPVATPTAAPPAPIVPPLAPPPQIAAPSFPKKPRAPTLVGIAPPPLNSAPRPASQVPPPEPGLSLAVPPAPAPTKRPPPVELPSIIVAPPEDVSAPPPIIASPLAPPPPAFPPPPPPPAPAPAPVFESAGRLEPHVVPARAFVASAFAFMRRRPIDRRLLVGAGGGAALLLVLFVVVIAVASRSPRASTVATADAAPTTTATTTATASATPTASATATATATAEPGPFEKRVALAAIAETTKDLTDCRRPHGVWGKGQVGVVFKNDGSVRYVMMSAPFNGPEGKCVARHIKETRIDPFVGIIGPIYANFVIPY
ncbi:MAG TPA: hypothetical protein VGH28_24975 [Polyangiaceae bacterium]|jgi:serine/threonine protein kinase